MPLALCPLSVSLRPLVQALMSCSVFRAPWSSAMHLSLEKGRVTTIFTICFNHFAVALVKRYYDFLLLLQWKMHLLAFQNQISVSAIFLEIEVL